MIGCYYPTKIRSGYKFKFLFVKIPRYILIPCLCCSWCKEHFKRSDSDMSYREYMKEFFR